ncbi:23S rRNA (adenine(2503)-C(2))-methyltransferase RlmN [bacterium]|nr:23S rRNA (adenine(2503)-C(2))-methyltransferase RlmN [bacterium]
MSMTDAAKIDNAPGTPRAAITPGRTPILGLPRDRLTERLREIGDRPYRADQIFRWLYKRDAAAFSDMTDVRAARRSELAAMFSIDRARLARRHEAADGTVKLLLEFSDGALVETVVIPETRRLTVCVSTQVGCSLTCRFCRTGTMRRERNLTAGEIVEQALAAGRHGGFDRPVTNVVFMGMGEPLYNYDATVDAANVLIDEMGPNFSARRVTISTAGVVPMIRKLGADTAASLAISLHAADDATRTAIMPINRKYPLDALIQACRDYPLRHRQRITYEYVMLDGVNDGPEDAAALRRLMAPLKAHVNLICFNPWEGCPYRPTPETRLRSFQRTLLDAKINCVVRRSRGQDILAACGQLKSLED